MGENRKDLKKRLLAAGYWQDYLALRAQLVQDGRTRREARKEALRQIDSRPSEQSVGPAPGSPSDDTSVEDPDPAKLAGEQGPDFTRHIPRHGNRMTAEECAQLARDVGFDGIPLDYLVTRWVATHVRDLTLRPEDAPNVLAWSLLLWVRRSPANLETFWDSIWRPAPLCERCGRKFAAPQCSPCLRVHRTVERLWLADFRQEALWLADWIQRHASDQLSVRQPMTDAEIELEVRLPPAYLVDMRLVAAGKV
jgi:hypothetical protein